MSRHEVVAVIPSLSGTVESLTPLVNNLRLAGAEAYILPTGARLDAALSSGDLPTVRIGDNPGFGATVTHALQQLGEWSWALIVNDDVRVDPIELGAVIEQVRGSEAAQLVYLDPVPPMPLPTRASTLGQVSLMTAVAARVRRGSRSALERQAVAPVTAQTHFRPFSIVLVSRTLWDALDGFDLTMIYTFEDADFGRRAAAAGARVEFPVLNGVQHSRHGTSLRHADAVIPVAAYSAAAYLVTLGVTPWRARWACAGALALRTVVVPLGGLPAGPHLRGIGRGIVALLTARPPRLPAFEDS